MRNARKFILNKTEIKPSGVTTIEVVTQLSILDTFNDYNQITETELSELTESEFSDRLYDFLIYAGVDSQELIDQLTNQAYYDEPTCRPTTTTTTTTTLAPEFPQIIFTFNVTNIESTIGFKLGGSQRIFTAKNNPNINNREFQASEDGVSTANSFVATVNSFLDAQGISSNYSVSRSGEVVTITSTVPDNPNFNFGPVQIENNNVISNEPIDASNQVPVTQDATFYLPGNTINTNSGQFFNPPADNVTMIVDIFAGNAPDSFQIYEATSGASVANTPVAVSSMFGINTNSVSTNFGYPSTGDFKTGGFNEGSGVADRNNRNKQFFIGTKSPSGNNPSSPIPVIPSSSNATIPNRLTEFQADTGIDLPLSILTLPNGSQQVAQQRLWVKNTGTNKKYQVRVQGAVPDGNWLDIGGNTGWVINVSFYREISSDIELSSEFSV